MKLTAQRVNKSTVILITILGVGLGVTPGTLDAGPLDSSRNQSVLEDAIQSMQWHQNIRRQPLPSDQPRPAPPRPGPAVEQPDLSGLPQTAPEAVQPPSGDAVPQPLLVKPSPGEPAQPNQPLIKPKLAEPSADDPRPRSRRGSEAQRKPIPAPQLPNGVQSLQPGLTHVPGPPSAPGAVKPLATRPSVQNAPIQAPASMLQPTTRTVEPSSAQPPIQTRGPVARQASPVSQLESDGSSAVTDASQPPQTEQPRINPVAPTGEAGQASPLIKPRIGPR